MTKIILIILSVYLLGAFVAGIVMLIMKVRQGVNILKSPWEYYAYGKQSDAGVFAGICIFWPLVTIVGIGYGVVLCAKYSGKSILWIMQKAAWALAGKDARGIVTLKVLKGDDNAHT